MATEGDVNDKATIKWYGTEQGLLLSMVNSGYHNDNIRINDKPLKPTFHEKWWLVEGEQELKSFKRHLGFEHINKKFVLKNAELPLPAIIPFEEVETNGDGLWLGKHKGLQCAYELQYDKFDKGFGDCEYEAEKIGILTFNDLGDPTKFSYKIHKEGWSGYQNEALDYKALYAEYDWLKMIEVEEFVKAIQPQFAWHLHPVKIGSHPTYRIIRSYVKDHIDPMWAEVTSDYDFCFTVKKKVKVKPYSYQYEPLFQSKRKKPRLVTKTVEWKELEIFQMTHAKSNYNGYVVVSGFEGNNIFDLAANIDAYLKALMVAINLPLSECQSCQGCGVVDFRKIPTNEREFA